MEELTHQDTLTPPIKPREKAEYLDRPKPTITGIEVKPREEQGRELFEAHSQKVAFGRIGIDGLDQCQDCWAVSLDEDEPEH